MRARPALIAVGPRPRPIVPGGTASLKVAPFQARLSCRVGVPVAVGPY